MLKRIKVSIKEPSCGASPSTFLSDATIKLYVKADKEVIKKVEKAIKDALND